MSTTSDGVSRYAEVSEVDRVLTSTTVDGDSGGCLSENRVLTSAHGDERFRCTSVDGD